MIVTFQPTINNASATDVTACYMNFLRCVTAIATAAAGTTSLTVNPFTASNTIDTTKNCIISIDSNTEAGGWITSASHNVISSLSNTPAAYTALPTAASYLYKADFYNASGKSTFPYKKLCFHSYNENIDGIAWAQGYGGTSKTAITVNKAANMLITFGASSSTDWTSTTFPPGGGVNTTQPNRPDIQSTSYTLNQNTHAAGNTYNQGPGLVYTDISIQYHMAITADYCIIWESKVGDSYATGYFNTTTLGNGTTGWGNARWASIYYMGLRETQPWENTLTNNVPWTCWQHTGDTGATAAGTTGQPYSHNQVAASMATINNSGIVTTTAQIYVTTNTYMNPLFFGSNINSGGRNSSEVGWQPNSYSTAYKMLDGPLFTTRSMGGSYFNGETGNSLNMLYMPQYDTTTGMQVPGAYPIKISRCFNGAWNPGGACRGIYKSLSMPYATMKLYWQAANQTFNINGDAYLPFVLNDDMWLVRVA